MAITKHLQNIRLDNQRRAIESHAGFVSYTVGMVQKVGLEVVMTAKEGDPYYYLRGMYRRVLDFAESLQLKMLPQKFEGDFQHTVTMEEVKINDSPLRFKIGNPYNPEDVIDPGEAVSDN